MNEVTCLAWTKQSRFQTAEEILLYATTYKPLHWHTLPAFPKGTRSLRVIIPLNREFIYLFIYLLTTFSVASNGKLNE